MIHAHGGHMLFHEGYYYRYGENRNGDIYVSCYRTADFTDDGKEKARMTSVIRAFLLSYFSLTADLALAAMLAAVRP